MAERKNWTILDMVRSMLKTNELPKEFWAKVVQCAVYIQNCCPHSNLGNEIPQELWRGRNPTVSHLKVFGSTTYSHVSDQMRTKLDDKSRKYISIGYDEKTKAYRILDPVAMKVVVSRDVKIQEDDAWNWNKAP